MNTRQIYNVLARDSITRDKFRGVYPSDLLNKTSKLSSVNDNYFVCNTQKHTEIGEHWIVIFIDRFKNVGEYFDSYGMNPLRVFKNFLDDNSSIWFRSCKTIQSPLSSVCGQYCIFYIYHKCLGYSLEEIIHLLDVVNPDKFVNEFVKHRYDGLEMLQEYDHLFIYNQIATLFK